MTGEYLGNEILHGSHTPKRFVHGLHQYLRAEVAVPLRNLNGGVPEDLLYDTHGYALHSQPAARGVPEVVKAKAFSLWELCLTHVELEPLAHPGGFRRQVPPVKEDRRARCAPRPFAQRRGAE
jgi:hypothetical protein